MEYLPYKMIIISSLLCVISGCATNSAFIKKHSDAAFKKPECVVYDEINDCLYISNINGSPSKEDGNGFVTKMSKEGNIIEQKWINGLDSPKGMFIKNNILYCSDIRKILLIDIHSKKLIETIKIPESKFLNDIIITNDNMIITTDSKENTVFIVKEKNIKKSIVPLNGANGIYYDGKKIFLGANGNINIYRPDIDSIEIIHEGIGNIDGLIVSEDRIFFSNYFNKLSKIENGIVTDIDKGIPFIDCRTDFCQLKNGTIIVPDFKSHIIFYKEIMSK